MATPSFGTGRSIVRGYSRAGLGEGPGRPIAHGEQYLSADPPFDEDSGLLHFARPWLTLDLEGGDLRKAGDRLEAWSVFSHGTWGFVARLVTAGTFDRRTAYRADAFGFPLESFGTPDDPGARLGCAAAFGGGGEPVPGPPGTEGLAEEPEVARSLLAHLLQALMGGPPVLVAVPVAELVSGGPIPGLVSFARAALPGRWKPTVRIRIYSRSPEIFLDRLSTHLLVIPDDLASAALSVRRDAVLLGRDGARLSGAAPDPSLAEYARKVVTEARRSPRSLLAFSSRLGKRIWRGDELPSERMLKNLGLAYQVIDRLDGREEEAAPVPSLLRQFRSGAARAPAGSFLWREVLTPEDWRRFPAGEVVELALAPAADLSDGERELQAAAAEAAADLGLLTGARLRAAWRADDPVRVGTLVALAGERPDLVPGGALAELLRAVSNRDLRRTGAGPEAVRLEAAHGSVEHRLDDPEDGAGTANQDLFDGLGTEELLHLVARGGAGRRDDRIAWRLAGRFRAEPAETTYLLLRFGAWSWWRSAMGEAFPDGRAAALCWLGAPLWKSAGSEHAVDPALEDWDVVMEDLGDGLSPEEVRPMIDAGAPGWPWIPFFESRQIRGMARRMPDLGLLAEWIEGCCPRTGGGRPDAEAIAVEEFLRDHPAARGLPPSMIRWLYRSSSGLSLKQPEQTHLAVLRSLAGDAKARLASRLEQRGPLERSRRGAPHLSRLVRHRDCGLQAVIEVGRDDPQNRLDPAWWQRKLTHMDARSARPEAARAVLYDTRRLLGPQERAAFDRGCSMVPAAREEQETRRSEMDPRVTFFTEKGIEEGTPAKIVGSDRRARVTLLAWVPEHGDRLVEDLTGEGGAEADAVVRDRVKRSGGVLARLRADGCSSVFAPARDRGGPGNALLLSPGREEVHVELQRLAQGVSLQPGQHLLVPVSAEAEARLFELRDLLSGFGPDLKALVMQTLRSPSLDLRVARLEQHLLEGRVSPGLVRSWWRRSTDTTRRSGRIVRKRLVLVSLILLTLVVIAGAATTMLRSRTALKASPALPYREGAPAPGGDVVDPEAIAKWPSELDEEPPGGGGSRSEVER